MAGKPISGDGLPANLAGMTKNQLYDIMFQMKTLIEQNKQQAREILIQNPPLTKALFQAQIMLGMLQPPQVIPNIQPAAASQQSQQSPQPPQQSNIQATHSLPAQVGLQDQTGAAQSAMRKQQQNLPSLPSSSAGPPINIQSQPMPSHALQMPQHSKGNLNPQATPITIPQPSPLPNMSSPPVLSSSQPILHHQHQMPAVSAQLQQPQQTSTISHLPLQPPLPPQQRLHSMPSYHHQYGQQMGFQHTSAPQHPSQPVFHSGNKHQPGVGSSFQQGQPPLQSQPAPQSLYQMGGSNLGADFNNQISSSMQADRGSPWISGPPDGSTMAQLPGAAPLVPNQMGSNQAGRSAALTPDMEKALLQQVMSLTQEQINLLPPEQRNQVLQLQQMLRQ